VRAAPRYYPMPGKQGRSAALTAAMNEEDLLDIECSFRQLVWRIAERVRPVCAHMPETEFRALIEKMATIEQKYIHHPNPVPKELRRAMSEPIWPE
jgi:hypothetical protein